MDFFTVPTLRLSNPVHLRDLESFPSPGRALCSDGASDDGLGDPATVGSDALWSTTHLFRDNDGIYGDEVRQFLVGIGLKKSKRPTGARGQNPAQSRVPYGIPALRATVQPHKPFWAYTDANIRRNYIEQWKLESFPM